MEPDALPHLLKLLLLLAVANGAPVLAKKAWGRTLAQPLDAGLLFSTGDRYSARLRPCAASWFRLRRRPPSPPLSGLPGGSAR